MKSIFTILITALSIVNLSGQINLDQGLNAYYPFENNADDQTENKNHGSIYSAALLDGISPNTTALFFDGEKSYVRIKNDDKNSFDTNEEFAISVWFRAYESDNADIISKWNSVHLDTAYSYAVRINALDEEKSGVISVIRYDGDGNCSGATVIQTKASYNDYKWHHLVFQLNAANELELYLDAQLIGRIVDQSTCSVRSNSDLLLGVRTLKNSSYRRPYKGILDELRIYDRGLTIDEINHLNDAPTSVTEYSNDSSISIYPNPSSSGSIFIKNSSDHTFDRVKIFNVLGEKIMEKQYSETIDVSELKGSYFVSLESQDGFNCVKKLILY